MNSDIGNAQVRAIAESLLRDGWEVIVEPSANQLPEWLQGFQPDAIAIRGSELRVIEVKSRNSVVGNEELRILSELVRENGGTFQLFTHADYSKADSLQLASQLLNEARAVQSAGAFNAAALTGWAAIEAGLIQQGHRRGVDVSTGGTLGVLRALYSADVISEQQFKKLQRIAKIRNALAHGRDGGATVSRDDIDWILDFGSAVVDPNFKTVAELVEWLDNQKLRPTAEVIDVEDLVYRTLEAEFPQSREEDLSEAAEVFLGAPQ